MMEIIYDCQYCGHTWHPQFEEEDCPKCGADEEGNLPDDEPRESLFEEQFENQSLYGGDDGHLDSYGEDY